MTVTLAQVSLATLDASERSPKDMRRSRLFQQFSIFSRGADDLERRAASNAMKETSMEQNEFALMVDVKTRPGLEREYEILTGTPEIVAAPGLGHDHDVAGRDTGSMRLRQ
jgi:hypothetical protein